MSPEETRIRKSIAALLTQKDFSFYGSILLRLKIVPCNLGTFATDGRRLLFDPRGFQNEDGWVKFEDITKEEMLGILAHEATHIAALHPLRKGARDKHMTWNVAADMEVNEVVVNQCGMSLPKGVIEGKVGLAEKHYDELVKNAPKCPKCGGKGEHKKDDKGEYNPECGGWCQVLPPDLAPGESHADARAEIENNVRQAIAQAQMWGNIPGSMEKIIEEFLTPKIKWDEVLREFVETVYEPKIDWASPSRRHLHRGIILPGNGRKRGIAEVAFAVDTSGSMYGLIEQAASEVRSVIDECYPAETQLPVIWFDTQPYVEYLSQDDPLIPKGGGGTRFACVMEAYEEFEMDQSGLVIITDGYCGEFGEEPNVPVLWIVFGDYADEFAPPFGRVVKLSMEEE